MSKSLLIAKEEVMSQLSIGYLMADVLRLVRSEYKHSKYGSQLTLAQAKALLKISHHQGVKQVELAEYLDIQPMTLVRLIDQLVQEGLIERRPDPNDRRAHLIYLLPAAQAKLVEVQRFGEQIWQQGLKGFTPQQTEAFLQALQTIRSNLSQ